MVPLYSSKRDRQLSTASTHIHRIVFCYEKHFSDNAITLLSKLVPLVACLQPSYFLFNLPEVFIFLLKKTPTNHLSHKKRRLIQFLNLQETVLFLINRNCAFTLLEMELHSYCLKKNENKDVRWIHRASFFKKYLFQMLQCKMQGIFIIIRNLSLKKTQYIFQIL